MPARKVYLDIAKGIAIILVVYAHAAAQTEGTKFYDHFLAPQIGPIFSVVMPLFFIISGYFQRRRLEQPNFNHRAYLFKIGSSLLLPFFSLSLAFLALNLIFAPLIHPPSPKDQLFSLLFQQSNTDLLPSGVLWFLFTLFECALFSYLLLKVLGLNFLVILGFSFLLALLADQVSSIYWFGINKFCEYFFTYLCGYFFLRPFEKHLIKIRIFAGCAFVLYLFLNFVVFFSQKRAPLLIIYSGAIGLSGTACLLWLSRLISQKNPEGLTSRLLSYYGRYSILVYVFHMPTFTLVKGMLGIIGKFSPLFYYLVLFLAGITFPLGYGKALSLVPRLYLLLLGRRP